jgi:hypothetical protein
MNQACYKSGIMPPECHTEKRRGGLSCHSHRSNEEETQSVAEAKPHNDLSRCT